MTQKIAIVMEHHAYASEVFAGVRRYADQHQCDWFIRWAGTDEFGLKQVRGWQPDGVIGGGTYHSTNRAVHDLGFPTVFVVTHTTDEPMIHVDNEKIGELAAQHLIEVGFRQLATFCPLDTKYARDRSAAFQKTAETMGVACQSIGVIRDWPIGWAATDAEFGAWLSGLPQPCGIFACDDKRAGMLMEAAHAVGLKIPEDIALVGVDNDPIICQLYQPSLTSIALPAEQIGYEAAGMLTDLLAGRQPEPIQHISAPLGIIPRESSRILAFNDPLVTEAVQYIREHARDGLSVNILATALTVSRRSLEIKFKSHLQQTPAELIRTTRLDTARRLLIDTDWAMPRIAKEAGYANQARLSEAFRKDLNTTPTAYRSGFRSG